MELYVLIENQTSDRPRLVSEHGLSMLVVAHGRRVLFDTGASAALVNNADQLGLGDDLARIDAVVLSHGHYDHTGGLPAVLERTRRPMPVHIRPGFFAPRLSTSQGRHRAIGVPLPRPELEARGARFIEEMEPREILPGFWLTGEIPMRAEPTAGEPQLLIGTSAADAIPDPFCDEQAMAVQTSQGLVVLVGCAHRGIVNSILAAKDAARVESAHAVFGGAHLRCADDTHVAWSVERTHGLVSHVALGHCTGQTAESQFAEVFAARSHPLRAGWHWDSDAA
jgi:7,8-dihydropterin-6-yl-methyl-4-(beta-D-ribofuranosyl)aminobenzene 5'-phosphate synthase